MAHLQDGISTQPATEEKRYRTNRQDLGWTEEQAESTRMNVSSTERFLSGLLGAGLLVRSIGRLPSVAAGAGTLMGAALLQRALTGHCAVYGSLGIDTHDPSDTSTVGRRKVSTARAMKVQQSTTIERPREELYRFWRKLENLPKVMRHVRSVECVNERLSHWVVDTLPGVPSIEWDAEIINTVDNERIGWRTLSGSSVTHAGSVEFAPSGNGQGTRITVTLQYDPPAGPVGAAIATLFGRDPNRTIAADLARFKEAMETEARSSTGSHFR